MINTHPISVPTAFPIPQDLNKVLPNHQTPWNVSSVLFQRITAQNSDQPFKISEILSSDPEFNFILKYFEHHKPSNYSIKRIVCIHNPDHTQMFESTLKNMEREANNPVFTPKGKEEEPKAERARVIARWEKQVTQFSPVEIKSSNSRKDSCIKAKVLPLWHGSSEEVCQSVFSSGFTSFGKHHYFDESAKKGNTKSTDKGYFGSGIYFTNSAHYASMYSQGHLLMVWVSMREPYPVVNDIPHPQKGSDMIKLEGHKHYQNYNSHYIPVASIEPHNPKCMNYYPCYKEQTPAWDEFVVFQTAQTLPRFWIELAVDIPTVVLSSLLNTGELLSLILTLLDKEEIKTNEPLVAVLQAKVDYLLELPETTHLSPEDDKFFKLAKRLQPEGEKISSSVIKLLLKGASPNPTSISPLESSKTLKISVPLSVASLSVTPPPSTLPAIVFGKEKWATYIGDVGIEPPLPLDIDKILKSPCPFWPEKKVEDTHLLTLIPQTVDGKPLTLNTLNELVQHPKKGLPTKYSAYLGEIKKEYGNAAPTSSYWILFTKDVIPKSRSKTYDAQKQLLSTFNQPGKVVYEMPRFLEVAVSLFTAYLQTGKRLYSDNPCTYTRCQERVSNHPDWSLVIGGFADGGLRIHTGNSNFYNPDNSENYGVGGAGKL